MSATCLKCLQEVTPSNANVRTDDLSDIGLEETLKKLYCTVCNICIAVQISQKWQYFETLLHSKKCLNGWHNMSGDEDFLIVYLMSQILYNETTEQSDPLFDFPDPGDLVKIYWKDGRALGFYSMKRRGTVVLSSLEKYEMNMLDTSFILKCSRRLGLGLSIFHDIASTYPGEDIAVSTPISKSMAHVIRKFLQVESSYKTKLWEVEGVGSQGNRKLLYYTVNNKLGIF